MSATVTHLDEWRSGRILRASERRQGLQRIAEIRAQLAGHDVTETDGRTGPSQNAREARHG